MRLGGILEDFHPSACYVNASSYADMVITLLM